MENEKYSEPSADYPLGGSIEPYDIEVEKEIMHDPVILPGHDPDSWIAKAEIHAEVGKPVEMTITPRDGYEVCQSCEEYVCETCGVHHLHIKKI